MEKNNHKHNTDTSRDTHHDKTKKSDDRENGHAKKPEANQPNQKPDTPHTK